MITEGINKVTLKGEILHVYENPYNGAIIVTIGTCGSKPNVVFLKGFAEYFKEAYKVGDFILVEGNIQSSYRPGRGIKDAIIADRILPLGNTYRKFENNFEVYGTIKSIVKIGDIHKVNVNVVANGYISTIPITFYYNDYRLNSSEVGEAIRVSGIVHTSKKEVNGKMRYYQNYVANGVL